MDIVRVNGWYWLCERLGVGTFSELNQYLLDFDLHAPIRWYLACDIIDGHDVAVELESISSKDQTLVHEFCVLKILGGGMRLPNIQWFGSEGGYNAIVFDCLGPSLEDLFIGSNYKICRRTVSNLVKQLVSQTNYFISVVNIPMYSTDLSSSAYSLLEDCDLKPSNILMGIGNWASIFYVIDLGLAKEFWNPDTHHHILFHCGQGLTGTSLFVSYHSHLGYELVRQDDFESLTYILIYPLCGGLPWQGLVSHDLIAQAKLEISIEEFCFRLLGKYSMLLSYSHVLAFNAKPDYDYLSGLFNEPSAAGGGAGWYCLWVEPHLTGSPWHPTHQITTTYEDVSHMQFLNYTHSSDWVSSYYLSFY